MLLSQTQKKRENKTKKNIQPALSLTNTSELLGIVSMRRFYLAGQQEEGGEVSDVTPGCGQIVIPKPQKVEQTRWRVRTESLRRFHNSRVLCHSQHDYYFRRGLLDVHFFFFIILRFPTPWKWQGFSNNNRKILQLLLKRHCGMAWLSLWDKMLKDYFSLSSALVIDWNFLWMSVARGGDRNAGSNKTGASSL